MNRKYKRQKIAAGTISCGLLLTLLIKLVYIPGGMILPAIFLGGIIIVGILIGCLIASWIINLFLKKTSFLTLYFISTAICFAFFHYSLYSPKLKIVVPKGYTGDVNLVLSNVDQNILVLDSNGIGYINKWTFDKTYAEPVVIEPDGTSIIKRCVGFNASTFWAKGTSSGNGLKINSLSFEIVPKNKAGQKQYYSEDLTSLVDKTKVKTKNSH